jgi:flagellar motor switch protein FliN/FliY
MAEIDDQDGISEEWSSGEEAEPAAAAEDLEGAVTAAMAGEAITNADHLDDQLEEDLGVEEALHAWTEGGHAEEDLDDADEVAPIQFAQLDDHPVKLQKNSDRLRNVMVHVTVELGRKSMLIRDLVNLKEQDYIELNKLAGEAFDILINKRPFAEGEIVVVTDVMAVRITRLREYIAGSPKD